jgi:hypothetical protein
MRNPDASFYYKSSPPRLNFGPQGRR